MRRLLLIAFTVAFSLAGCRASTNPWDNVPGGPPRVLASFAPLYCFTKNVAGDDCAVLSLLSAVGPHDHKPTQDDALAVSKANLFFINGLDLEGFPQQIVNSSGNRSIRVVPVAEAIPPGKGKGKRITVKEIEEELPAGEELPHVHGVYDPHAWLGIDEAIIMVEKIRDELQKLDPAHKDGYQERAAKYIQELRELQSYGEKLLEGKKNRAILAQHDSLRYFARSFGLKVVGTIQLTPGSDPDAKTMAELLAKCKKREVQVIAIEPQYGSGAAEKLQSMARKEAPDLALVTIDPIETAPRADLDAGYYTRMMRANLEALAKQLK